LFTVVELLLKIKGRQIPNIGAVNPILIIQINNLYQHPPFIQAQTVKNPILRTALYINILNIYILKQFLYFTNLFIYLTYLEGEKKK